MKKCFPIVYLFLFASIFLACNKSDIQDQVIPTNDEQVIEAKCGCACPRKAPTAIGISYSLSFWQPLVVIEADITYRNPGPDGTFRFVLRDAAGSVDTVAIVAAPSTTPGNPALLHLEFQVPADGFPYTLHANGRPGNRDCEVRSHRSFLMENAVSKSY